MKELVSIYLDDIRPTPDGYDIRTYTVEETIKALQENDGNVYWLSLDNDLGIGYREGKDVMKWIEEQAFYNQMKPINHIFIHTSNPAAEEEMMRARYNAYKYWEQMHGYDISL